MDTLLSDLKLRHNFRIVLGVEVEFYLIYDFSDKLFCDIQKKFKCQITKEVADNQYEFKVGPSSDILDIINTINDIKAYFLNNANDLSYSVSFNSKPYKSKSASAMHFNISLLGGEGEDVFIYFDGKPNLYLSYVIGGLCSLMKESMSAFAPNESSYHRFVEPDIHTPTTVSWGRNNRSAAIRIPVSKIVRIEHRVSSSDCNPYLAFKEIVRGILFGLDNKINPPEQIYGVASSSCYMCEKLPLSLAKSINYAK